MLGRNNRADMDTLLLLKKISAFMQMGLEEYELSLKGILLICFQRLYSQYFAKLRTSDVKVLSFLSPQKS